MHKFVFSVSSLLFSILMAEILLATFAPITQQLEVQRITVKQNLKGLKNEFIFSQDQYGLRSRSLHSTSKLPGTIRILCLGASTTKQSAQAIEDTWSGILDEKLNQTFAPEGIKIEVAAWGHGGLGVWSGSSFCRDDMLSLEPDIVINLWGINDLTFGTDRGWQPEKKTDLAPDPATTTIYTSFSNWIERRQIYLRVKLLIKSFQPLNDGKALPEKFSWASDNIPRLRQEYADLPFQATPQRALDPLQQFSEGLDTLLSCLERHHTKSIVMGQPTLWSGTMGSEERNLLWFWIEGSEGKVRTDPAWMSQEMDRFNTRQKELAEKHKSLFIPLDKLIPKNSRYFYDDCHYTDEGSALVSEIIFPTVKSAIEQLITHN